MICEKILPEDEYARDIRFVRVHRLEGFKRDTTRPIIARFECYTDKMDVIKSCKNLSVTGQKQQYFVSEDFSANTTNLRKNLQSLVKVVKTKLNKRIKSTYVKHTFLAIRYLNDKLRTFSIDYLLNIQNEHPSDWWESLLAYGNKTFQGGNWSANRQPSSTNQHPASPLIEDITEYDEHY